jgi:hypothetical protein
MSDKEAWVNWGSWQWTFVVFHSAGLWNASLLKNNLFFCLPLVYIDPTSISPIITKSNCCNLDLKCTPKHSYVEDLVLAHDIIGRLWNLCFQATIWSGSSTLHLVRDFFFFNENKVSFNFFLYCCAGGGTLWHLQGFLQSIKYTILEFTPRLWEESFWYTQSIEGKAVKTGLRKILPMAHISFRRHQWIPKCLSGVYQCAECDCIQTIFEDGKNSTLMRE